MITHNIFSGGLLTGTAQPALSLHVKLAQPVPAAVAQIRLERELYRQLRLEQSQLELIPSGHDVREVEPQQLLLFAVPAEVQTIRREYLMTAVI